VYKRVLAPATKRFSTKPKQNTKAAEKYDESHISEQRRDIA
jgi:hypothetical protein